MLLIGLCGAARTGKDTIGEYLADRHGLARLSFAGPLKVGLRAMLGLQYEHTDGALKETPLDWLGGVSPRRLLQTLGTEWGRDTIDKDIWIKVCSRQLDRIKPHEPGAVITDVRFANEADMLRKRGGWVIKVERDDAPAVAGHVSEGQVFAADATVFNNGSFEDLRHRVDYLMEIFHSLNTRKYSNG